MSTQTTQLPKPLYGLLLCAVLAGLALLVTTHSGLAQKGVSALVVAIGAGMLLGNLLAPRNLIMLEAGCAFARQRLLRLAIVLYGLRLDWLSIVDLGWVGFLAGTGVLVSTFLLACLLGRLLGVGQRLAMLVGAGASICGAAAIMATGPVVRARDSEVAIAVATVVVFGTLAMVLHPLLYHLLAGYARDVQTYGLVVGATVHEVAQVVVAGSAIQAEAAEVAVLTKMTRVMLLAPFLLLLSGWARHSQSGQGSQAVQLPWFAFGFLLMSGVQALQWIPPYWEGLLIQLGDALLAMAMVAMGLGTRLTALRAAGVAPMLLAGLLLLWLLLVAVGLGYWLQLG